MYYSDRSLQKTKEEILEIVRKNNPSQNHFEMLRAIQSIYANSENKIDTVVEIGVHRGGSLGVWSEVFKPTLVIGLDDDAKAVSEFKKTVPNTHILAPVRSQEPDTVNKVKELLGSRKIDFLFIDGDHRYSAVKKDFEFYGALCTETGVVGFHDIFVTNHPDVEVERFWKEIIPYYKFRWFHDSHDTGTETGTGLLFL